MASQNDLSELYDLRSGFTVIALTGRTGSGCTTLAKLMEKGFNSEEFINPLKLDLNKSSYKKYDIVYKFSAVNFKSYKLISYVKVLTLFLLKNDYNSFITFLGSDALESAINDFNLKLDGEDKYISSDFSNEIKRLKKDTDLENKFNKLRGGLKNIDFLNFNRDKSSQSLFDIFYGKEFEEINNKIHLILRDIPSKHNFLFQFLSNNLRKSGLPYNTDLYDTKYVFTIALYLNALIKSIRHINKKLKKPTKIVIDSIRNPFEVMFFKQRYSAFYLLAVNKEEELREKDLIKDYVDYEKLKELLLQEYIGGKGKKFYKQYVRDCLEKADIHISFRSKDEVDELNRTILKNNENTTPAFTWQMQVIKYLSLIDHPGLITPSPEERSMQMAYTAKYNSGCISRQVGAAIFDENYSVKAIGWNNTPEGQTPCLLRQTAKLIDLYKNVNNSNNATYLDSFTPFEKSDMKFKKVVLEEYEDKIKVKEEMLKGRNVCFCFKSIHNACYDGKNQVQTRALHAEESAFLQITKYGGTGIKGGKLFVTSSPCELCSKKAYQLGIKIIYYIDPYPGIADKQILKVGSNQPQVRLFNGAIGNAYHSFYEPLMPYKDELSLLLSLDIKDLATKQEQEIINLKKKLRALSKA